MKLKFSIAENAYIELFKLLKIMKIASSGSEAKLFIDEGLVYLNGLQEFRRRAKVKSGDTVNLNLGNKSISILIDTEIQS
ncbi:MAG: RNA-binding S4 domain-containing protein [Prevotellaceae bacterium]|jgi:ribosome-associated protein|nr:RNA-binding S4 domain-containing protein [Prevotellaceae bacterium]